MLELKRVACWICVSAQNKARKSNTLPWMAYRKRKEPPKFFGLLFKCISDMTVNMNCMYIGTRHLRLCVRMYYNVCGMFNGNTLLGKQHLFFLFYSYGNSIADVSLIRLLFKVSIRYCYYFYHINVSVRFIVFIERKYYEITPQYLSVMN